MMKHLTKVAIGLLLGFGIPITLLATTKLLEPNPSPQDREEAKAALVIFGLIPLTMGGIALHGARQQSQAQRTSRLQNSFFRLLQKNGGHITSLQFAMATGLNGRAAQSYLDERAREFNAVYHITAEGNISYFFELAPSLQPN